MSTVAPSVARSLAPRAEARGASLLDAPVSGSEPAARTGTLTIMVGGEEGARRSAEPVLRSLGSRIVHLGPSGSGAVTKLAVNTIVFALNAAVAEALLLAERAGVDRDAAYGVFASSAVGAPLLEYKRRAYLEPDDAPVAFTLELAAQDLRLALELARTVGVRLPGAELNVARIDEAALAGPGRDFAWLAQAVRSPS
jgi:3-hydroxyisobutyrate dehydrogenase/2-hydroxy-3-oxopropionate reductase